MNDSTPIPHPDHQRLADENALLRDELVRLLAECHELVHTVKPNLSAHYQTKIGQWELRRLEAECAAARLKRKIELVQAALNRGSPPDLPAIEVALALEHLTWQRRLEEAAAALPAAEIRLKSVLSPEDDRAFKQVHRVLVKKLHPDLNPALSEDLQRLWTRVQSAYAAADLGELRALVLLVEQPGETAANASSADMLQQERETLRRQIARTLQDIARIESQPPFTLRRQLEDAAWVEGRREEIERRIDELRQSCAEREAQLHALLKNHGGPNLFGQN